MGRRLLLAFCLFLSKTAIAGPPRVLLGRLEHAPRIDGIVRPGEWHGARIVRGLVQSRPRPGAPASERTTVYLGFHGDSLYVAFVCFQKAPIRAIRAQRDDPARSDRVWVMLDTFLDGRTGYVFGLTAAGTLLDGRLFADGRWDLNWNGVWGGAVRATRSGWSAELRIPTANLRWPSQAAEWGLGLRRYVASRQEVDDWRPIPKGASGLVSYFGRLAGVGQVPFRFHTELRPYVAAGTLVHRGPDSSVSTPEAFRAGLDVLLAPRPDWSVQLTVWPDFGQVEVDPTIVNLTNYEVYLPEKRPFFLEDAAIFKTPFQVFYSRRIGALEVSGLASDETVESQPTAAPIWGAVRSTGAVGRWKLAGLAALVGPAEGTIGEPDGSVREGRISHLAFYGVERAVRSLGRRSAAGLLAASVVRQDGLDVHVLSADVNVRDFRPYAATAQVVTSLSSDSQGWGALLAGGRTEAPGWQWRLQMAALSPDLDLNSTGFSSRNDVWELRAVLSYELDKPTALHRAWTFGLEAAYDGDWEGLCVRRFLRFWANHVFRNTWMFQYSYELALPAYDDWTTSGGVALPVPRSHRVGLALTSDNRRKVVGRLHGWVRYRESQGPGWGLDGWVRADWGGNTSASLSADYRELRGWEQFVGAGEGDLPVFGVFDYRKFQVEARLQVDPLPGLALQAFGQLVWAEADFDRDGYFLLRDPAHRVGLADQGADWTLRALRVNVRLRWDLDARTVFYVAYAHIEEWNTGDVGWTWQRFRALWARGGDDLFLVKLDRRFWL